MSSSADDQEEGHSEAPRKGRSNAILTYETVARMDKNLAEANVKLDTVIKTQQAGHTDHEVRLRVVETSVTAMQAERRQSSLTWTWVWPSLFSATTVIISLLTFLRGVGK